MKMVCVMVSCLAALDLSAKVITLVDLYLARETEQEVESVREEFKDAAKVREAFEKGLLLYGTSKQVAEFKRKFGVGDEPMSTVLMEIIREGSAKAANPKGESYDSLFLQRALRWLGVCAGEAGKRLLMDIATNDGNCYDARACAIEAYLRRANPPEARDAITRFTGDGMRVKGKDGFPVYLCVYEYALQAYDEADGDPQKREAIVFALPDVLIKEESATVFIEVDKSFAERSREYAESPQRKAALERFGKQPEKPE